jgi:hypothetical protein
LHTKTVSPVEETTLKYWFEVPEPPYIKERCVLADEVGVLVAPPNPTKVPPVILNVF